MGVKQESLGIDRLTEYEAAEMSKNFRVRQIEEVKQDYQKKADRLLNDYYRDGSKTLKGYDQNMEIVSICELAIKQIRQEGHNETVRYANTEAMAKGLDKDTYTKQEVSALIMQTLMF